MEEGARLCTDFVKMAQERAEIEAKYVKNLQQWSRKWDDLVSKGPEYGTILDGWKAALREATRLAEVHVEVHRKIQDELVESMNSWRAEHYHRSIVNFKEIKKAEDGFLKAQKPWATRLQKTSRARKAFHQAARELEAQNSSLQSSESNPDCNGEQLSKVRERRDKAQREVDKTLAKYKEKLGDLQHYQGRYIEDMKKEFEKCQDFEQERIEFFKRSLMDLQTAVDLSNNERVLAIYDEYSTSLNAINALDDLKWYSVHHGADMSCNWPQFEDYVPGGLTGSKQNMCGASYSPAVSSGTLTKKKVEFSTSNSSSPTLQRAEDTNGGDEWIDPPPEKEDYEDGVGDEDGVLMRALYDYEGGDEDDLTFKEGDIVRIVQKGKDGWAHGILEDKYGYVPYSYFEPVVQHNRTVL
ncbi:hypothetical protein EMCRGX_G008638 [Ephydatia muelleri]|eukprot:Em0003g41a